MVALCLLGLAACSQFPFPLVNVDDAIQTGVFQTQQISELETAAAGAGVASTPAAEAIAPQSSGAADCPNPVDPPRFDEISLPAALGTLQQNGDRWLLNDTEVTLVNHLNDDCSSTLWLTLAGVTEWPLLLQDTSGAWQLGSSEWTTDMVVMNTNDAALSLEIIPVGLSASDTEGQLEELSPYEILNVAALPPGQYQLIFSFEVDQPLQLSCTIAFQPDSRYVFSVVPVGVAVFSDKLVPLSSADVDVTTSPLCQE